MSLVCKTHDECNEGSYCDPTLNMCDPCTTCLGHYSEDFCSRICPGGQEDDLDATIKPINNKPLPPGNLINNETSDNVMNTEVAVALVVSGFLAVFIVAVLILFIVKKRRRKPKEHIEEGHEMKPLQAEQTHHGEIAVPMGNQIDIGTTKL